MARNPGLCGMVEAAKRDTANGAFIMSPAESMSQKKLLLKLLIKEGMLYCDICLSGKLLTTTGKMMRRTPYQVLLYLDRVQCTLCINQWL